VGVVPPRGVNKTNDLIERYLLNQIIANIRMTRRLEREAVKLKLRLEDLRTSTKVEENYGSIRRRRRRSAR
jgi:hypothetical protein